MAFGDSLTEGYALPPEAGYPARLTELLSADGADWLVVNAGVSGETTGEGLRRLPRVLARFRERFGAEPDGVLLELGTNDAVLGLPLEEIRANLETMLDLLAGLPVLLLGVGPWSILHDAGYARDVAALYAELAETHGCPLYPDVLAGLLHHPDYLLHDELHPNAAGYAHLARALAPLVRSLMRADR